MSSFAGQRGGGAAAGVTPAAARLVNTVHGVAGLDDACAAALGLGTVTLLAVDDGGYFPGTWTWSAVGLAAAAALGLLLRGRGGVSRLGYLAFGALAALAAWMLASTLWGVPGTEAGHEAARASVYVAGLAALLAVGRGSARGLLAGVLCRICAIELYALGERVVAPPPLDPFQGALLVGPVGYANALGMLAAVGVLLALGLGWNACGSLPRALCSLAAVVSAVALGLTSSRGSLLALAVGLLVLVLVRGHHRPRVVALVVAAFAMLGMSVVLHPPSFGDRPAYWQVAIQDAAGEPLLGSGAGSFDDVWLKRRSIPANVRDAHSVYLEVLAELGPMGLLLLLGALAPPLVAFVRAPRGTGAVAAAPYCAFLVHAGLDWDWEMPVTTLTGLACGATLLVSPHRPGES